MFVILVLQERMNTMKALKNNITFALYFGNRGFFPGEVIASAREEMKHAVKNSGFDYICMDEELTRYFGDG